MAKEIKYEIEKTLGVLSTSESGWTKEVNLMSWNDGPKKYDIREWAPERKSMSKGITLTQEELKALIELAKGE